MTGMFERYFAAFALAVCLPAAAQTVVTEVSIRSDRAPARVRPFGTLILQSLIYGEQAAPAATTNSISASTAKVAESETPPEPAKPKLRLPKAGVFRVIEPDGGWISKPFKYQGATTEAFHYEQTSGFRGIFSRLNTEVIQDAVLYTAPEKPGKYTIEAELDGIKGSLVIEVDPEAAPSRPPERIDFPAETRPEERYRTLAEHYAPYVAQETWFDAKADYLARFDYDGDWRGDNNWDSLDEGSSQAYVYYAAMETSTHWFLIYNFFHPRDYSDQCLAGSCHENDNEGLVLTVAKDGTEFGRLQAMETLAHDNVYSYTADSRIRNGIHNIDGPIELHDGSHPVVFIEAGGHGVYGSRGDQSRYSADRKMFSVRPVTFKFDLGARLSGGGELPAGTGVTYLYKGLAERPKHANDREVGYDLLPIYNHWWLRAAERSEAFDSFAAYQPSGRRPAMKVVSVGTCFLGRKHAANKAKPFWGWHDRATLKKKLLSPGQWALDPAYAVSQDLRFPPGIPFSLDYIYNQYLGIP